MNIPKIFASSVDANKLSLTLKGLIPLVLIGVKIATGTEIQGGALEDVVDGGILVLTAVITLIGAIRKLKNR